MAKSSYNTQGVPEPEDSAKAQREATKAFPDDNNMSPPRCYEQCVEGGSGGADDDAAKGQGPVYQD